jgi:hypothetical protein
LPVMMPFPFPRNVQKRNRARTPGFWGNDDTELLSLTSAPGKPYSDANAFGKSLVSSHPMSEAAYSAHGMRDAHEAALSPRFTEIVIQQSTQPLTPLYSSSRFSRRFHRHDQPVSKTLMVTFEVIEPRNTIPPSTKSAKFTILGIPCTAKRFMCMGNSRSKVESCVAVRCPGKKLRSGLKCHCGC